MQWCTKTNACSWEQYSHSFTGKKKRKNSSFHRTWLVQRYRSSNSYSKQFEPARYCCSTDREKQKDGGKNAITRRLTPVHILAVSPCHSDPCPRVSSHTSPAALWEYHHTQVDYQHWQWPCQVQPARQNNWKYYSTALSWRHPLDELKVCLSAS